jgi:RNA polymerase sigma factor (sigma-70 family)
MPVLEAAPTLEEQHRLCLRWSGLVAHVARRLMHRGDVAALGLDDAMSAGYVGLVRAARKYDPARGEFKNFAWSAIVYAILTEAASWLDRSADLSIDAPGADGTSLAEELPGREPADPADAEAVEQLLRQLPDRESLVLRQHLGIGCDPRPLSEVGAALGVSGARAGQLARQGIERLRCLLPAE